MKKTVVLLSILTFTQGVMTAATVIAVNFLRDAPRTPAANDGSEFGISSWVDVLAPSGSLTTDGVSLSWGGGAWSGGSSNNIENGYIDNATTLTVSGLDSWLAANNATTYTVQLIQASDTADNWFGNTELRDTNASGALLDTLTNANLRNGPSSVSSELSAATLFIDPTTGGTAPAGGVAARTNVAGLIITAIPEPSSALLLGLGSLAFLVRRRK